MAGPDEPSATSLPPIRAAGKARAPPTSSPTRPPHKTRKRLRDSHSPVEAIPGPERAPSKLRLGGVFLP